MDKNSPAKKRTIPVLLVIVWIAIAVLFGYSIWAGDTDNGQTFGGQEAVIADAHPEAAIRQATADMSQSEKQSAAERDQQRVADIRTIRSGLGDYYEATGHYPSALDDLVPAYLDELPSNPTPGGTDYSYTGIGSAPFMYYDLVYSLEVGTDDIGSGQQVANPSGLSF